MSGHIVRVAEFAVLLAVAIIVGAAATTGVALLGHAVLVVAYGEDLTAIDDTLPMVVAVWGAYLTGILSGLVVLVLGWRRIVRRPPSDAGPRRVRD
jgi:hypothetical protein